MKKGLKFLVFHIALLQFSLLAVGQDVEDRSYFASGQWYKIGVTEDGIYKIDATLLESLGINSGKVDPGKISLIGNGGKMLPQSLEPESISKSNLKQIPLKLYGMDDGKFDGSDFVLFYGEGPDQFIASPDNQSIEYQNHLYSDTTYYFLSVEFTHQNYVTKENIASSGGSLVDTYVDYRVHERDIQNVVKSGREWFGEKFDLVTDFTFPFEFRNVDNSKPVSITADVLIRSRESSSSFEFALNGEPAGQIEAEAISFNTYSPRGIRLKERFELPEVQERGSNIDLDVKFNRSEGSSGYINYLLVTAHSRLIYSGEQFSFRSLEDKEEGLTFQISTSGTEDIEVWDISNQFDQIDKITRLNDSSIEFNGINNDSIASEFVIFTPSSIQKKPFPVKEINNQDLRSLTPPDLLIVTHQNFISEANRLADLRRSYDGLTVEIVTVDKIFNEFGSGSRDITAIRNFIYHLREKDENSLKYVLFFGKGSYDFKSVIDNNINLVPIYQSRNSTAPLRSYASDDYFALLDPGEGEWPEDEDNLTYDLDLATGRIPVVNLEQAKNVVDKLYKYAYGSKSIGSWRKDIVFIADDVDLRRENDTHIKQSQKLSILVDTTYNGLNVKKIFVDAFEQVKVAGGERVPEVNDMINQYVEDGALILNFTGHGGETIWTSERILDLFMINTWDNPDTYPLFVTATCEFGRNDDPERPSGAEEALLRSNGGAIGLITTTRPVFSFPNFVLNTALYQKAFEKIDNRYPTIGEIFMNTKNEINDFNSRNFMLLGDLSMKLAYPDYKVNLESINGYSIENDKEFTDTLGAFEKVTVSGNISDLNGNIISGYDGTVEVKLFGQPVQKSTLGFEENQVIDFEERSNILFNGKAKVNDGNFSIQFTLPGNTPQEIGEGKLSFYAWSDLLPDASGGFKDFSVGGQPDNLVDDEPPSAFLFLGDSTFQTGDVVNENTRLLARLTDNSGIDISYDIDNPSLYAILDDTSQIDLTNYYTADIDTERSGWVDVPLKRLAPGKHSVILYARDLNGNQTVSETTFLVSEDNSLVLKNLYNYPNPFTDHTNIVFTQNRSGEDLEVKFMVYSSNGMIVKENEYFISDSNLTITDLEWDGRMTSGKKLGDGIYYYRIIVRSLKDGAVASISQKFVIN